MGSMRRRIERIRKQRRSSLRERRRNRSRRVTRRLDEGVVNQTFIQAAEGAEFRVRVEVPALPDPRAVDSEEQHWYDHLTDASVLATFPELNFVTGSPERGYVVFKVRAASEREAEDIVEGYIAGRAVPFHLYIRPQD